MTWTSYQHCGTFWRCRGFFLSFWGSLWRRFEGRRRRRPYGHLSPPKWCPSGREGRPHAHRQAGRPTSRWSDKDQREKGFPSAMACFRTTNTEELIIAAPSRVATVEIWQTLSVMPFEAYLNSRSFPDVLICRLERDLISYHVSGLQL